MKGMKFNFKIQSYQTDAVDSIVSVFAGQPKFDETSEYTQYTRDLGKKPKIATKEEVKCTPTTFLKYGR